MPGTMSSSTSHMPSPNAVYGFLGAFFLRAGSLGAGVSVGVGVGLTVGVGGTRVGLGMSVGGTRVGLGMAVVAGVDVS